MNKWIIVHSTSINMCFSFVLFIYFSLFIRVLMTCEGTEVIVRLARWQQSNSDERLQNQLPLNYKKYTKARTMCIILGVYLESSREGSATRWFLCYWRVSILTAITQHACKGKAHNGSMWPSRPNWWVFTRIWQFSFECPALLIRH